MSARVASRGVAVLALLCAFTSSACDDDKKKTGHTVTFGQDPNLAVAPPPVASVGTNPATPTPEQIAEAHARAMSSSTAATAAPSAMATGAAMTAPAAATSAATAPKVNPDDAILERTRVACGSCFASLPAGASFGPPTRSAHVSVTVIPTGTVSRADVGSNDTTDANVLDCIKRTAEAATFSDNGGGPLRTYAIEVRVSAPGANGSR